MGKLGALFALMAATITGAMAQVTAPVPPAVDQLTATALTDFYADITPVIGYVFTALVFAVTLHFIIRKIRHIGSSV